jgi:AcrR family transcriptional regulator
MPHRTLKGKRRKPATRKSDIALPERRYKSIAPLRRGRPSAAQANEVDRRILQSATERFLSEGYELTTMDAVAAMARVSKMTLYDRFPDKRSLLLAVMEESKAAWGRAAAKQDWKLGGNLEQRLRHLVAIIMTWASHSEMRAFDRLLATAPPEVARPVYARRAKITIERLAQEIQQFTAAEGRPAKNPRQVAGDLLALLAGWMQLESNARVVSRKQALEFGRLAVDRMLAARSSW